MSTKKSIEIKKAFRGPKDAFRPTAVWHVIDHSVTSERFETHKIRRENEVDFLTRNDHVELVDYKKLDGRFGLIAEIIIKSTFDFHMETFETFEQAKQYAKSLLTD